MISSAQLNLGRVQQDYYANHFKDGADGKLDMFPAQALETWQCLTVPPTRSDCVTNPMPQVAGLHALLPRLLALSNTVVPAAATRAKWEALAKRVPALPVGPCMQGGSFSPLAVLGHLCSIGAAVLSSTLRYHLPFVSDFTLRYLSGPGKGRATCLLPGAQLPAKPSNAENADLCARATNSVLSRRCVPHLCLSLILALLCHLCLGCGFASQTRSTHTVWSGSSRIDRSE